MAREKERKGRRDREDKGDSGESEEDIEKSLNELEGAWEDTEAQEGFGDIPDDTYQAKITGANINRSKSSQRLQLTVEFTVAVGKFKNRKKWSHYGLETPENLGWVKGLFARLKVDPPKKLSMLGEACEQLIGTTCEISVKTRGDFQNVYVQKPIDLDDNVEEADDWEPSDRSKKGGTATKDRDDDDDRKSKSKSKDDDADDDDDDRKSKKGGRADDDDDQADDDDRPAKSKRRDDDGDDDDDDDRKKKSSRDDDDDDDDRKSSKSKKDDEDDDDDRTEKKRSRDDDDDDDRAKKRKSKF